MFTVAVLTISDRSSRGERPDLTGPALIEIIEKELKWKIVDYRVVADEKKEILWELKRIYDLFMPNLILTNGGTGISSRDVTPEATLEFIDRRVPGFEEIMRVESFKITPAAILSRAVVGIKGKTLIINLPGSPKGAAENLRIILPAIPHAIEILKGISGDCHPFQGKGS